ncbi:MAG: hypothetical protein OEV72_14005 [Thermoleophilia bacterium]|nr:hypothetical protein [Thermoleophilia bacterium]
MTVDGAAAGPFSALVRFTVDQPARVVIEYGTGPDTQVWTKQVTVGAGVGTELRLTALEPATSYRFRVLASSGTARGVAEGSVVTPRMPTSVRGRTIRDALVVNGQRFFPRMVWQQCPYAYATSIAAGINTFMGTGCVTPQAQLGALGGRALSIIDVAKRAVGGPGLVGWHHLDEADEHVGSPAGIPRVPSSRETGRVSFLTLTNHFYSGASPLPHGREMYPGLIDRTEMVGFNLYPLQVWCRKNRFHDVYEAQRELVTLAAGRPTFQWIEAGPMNQCFGLDPSPAIVRAETWLAIAGGARGIGFFPDQWRPDVRAEVRRLSTEIASLSAALLAPAGEATVTSPSPIRVGVRRWRDATYVIAVNPTFARVGATITVPGLGTAGLRVYGDGRWVTARDDSFSDRFRGLEARIYVAPPPGTT